MVLDLRRAFCSSIPKEDDDDDDQQTVPSNVVPESRVHIISSKKLITSFFSSPLSTPRRSSYSSSSAPSSPKHDRRRPAHGNDDNQQKHHHQQITSRQQKIRRRVYNDDEPLSSPAAPTRYNTRFNSIPEEDQYNIHNLQDDDDFPGFFVDHYHDHIEEDNIPKIKGRLIEIDLLPHSSELVLLTRGGSHNTNRSTYGVILRIKALADHDHELQRVPIDLVMVIHVGNCDHVAKRAAMRNVIASLTSSDRLSIVGYFTGASKRLLPLRRMNAAGRRAARRIVDEIAVVSADSTEYSSSSMEEAVRKAAKVVWDRREKNAIASIVVLRGERNGTGDQIVSLITRLDDHQDLISSTVPVGAVNLGALDHAPDGDSILTGIIGLSGAVVLQDVKVQLALESGSGEILAVYSDLHKPGLVGSGSDWIRVGDFYSKEDKELLIELDGPNGSSLTVRCSYTDPLTHEKQVQLLIPRPGTVGAGSSDPEIQRLRCRFVVARAMAESRRLIERNDAVGARRVLAWARAIALKTGSGYLLGLGSELAELDNKLRRNEEEKESTVGEPVSAWKVAQRLASMRKSLNRVGDLHGLEDARF